MLFSIKNAKYKFIIDEFWILSVNDGFGTRNKNCKVYNNSNVSDTQKTNFKNCLRCLIDNFVCEYIKKYVNDKTHCNNILKIVTWSRNYSNILWNGHLSGGVAQKVFNSYLKHLWTSGFIDMPPHFPIDKSIVDYIKKNVTNNIISSWTSINNINDYVNIIDAAKIDANKQGLSLSVWELCIYNKTRNYSFDNCKTILNCSYSGEFDECQRTDC